MNELNFITNISIINVSIIIITILIILIILIIIYFYLIKDKNIFKYKNKKVKWCNPVVSDIYFY